MIGTRMCLVQALEKCLPLRNFLSSTLRPMSSPLTSSFNDINRLTYCILAFGYGYNEHGYFSIYIFPFCSDAIGVFLILIFFFFLINNFLVHSLTFRFKLKTRFYPIVSFISDLKFRRSGPTANSPCLIIWVLVTELSGQDFCECSNDVFFCI